MLEFHPKLIGYVVSELRWQNKYSASKPNGVLMGSASEATNRGYVLANCPRPPPNLTNTL